MTILKTCLGAGLVSGIVLGLGACAARSNMSGGGSDHAAGDNASRELAALHASTWQLATLDGRAVSALEPMGSRPRLPELVFSPQGRVGGFSGVNRMFAEMSEADVRAGRVDFSKIGMTMMAGPPEAMDMERRFTGALAGATRWRIDGQTLFLTDNAGKRIATFRAAGPVKGK